MDTRMQRVKKNVVTTFGHQLITTLCGLVIPWIMIETFGSAQYGATTSIAQFLAYITLLEGGIGRVARGALYKPLAEQDQQGISQVYLAVKRFFSGIGIGFAVYAVLLALVYHRIAEVSIFDWEYTFWLVLSIAVGKFAEYMGGISKVTLFNADQRQYVVSSAYIVTNVLNAVLIFVLCRSGVDILWVKLTSSMVFVLRPIIFSVYLRRHYHIQKHGVRAKLPNKFTGLAQHTAYVIQNNTDVLILTVLSDLKTVAVYSVYHLIIFSMRNLVTSFTGGMEALLGEMVAKGEQKELQKTYRTYKFLLTILSVTLFGTTAVMILPFVGLYTARVDDVNYIRPVFALMLVLSEALNCLVLPCFNLTIASNKLKESQIGAYGEAAVNVVVSLLLVIFWDPLVGVAVGTLAATLFKCVYYIVFTGRHILKGNTLRMVVKMITTLLVLIEIAVGGVWLMEEMPVSNYFIWALWGIASVVVTGVVGLALGMVLYPGQLQDAKRVLLRKKAKKPENFDAYAEHDIAAYAGYVEDRQERLACSSGGLATALARQMVAQGGYVAGVTYTPDFKGAVYAITNRMEDLEEFKGSKYCDVEKGTVYADVKALLESGESVLFFGLPCVVAALRSYLGRDYDTLLTVELICHGPTTATVHRQYVEHLEQKYHSTVVDFSVKKKKETWTPAYLYAAFENGQTFMEPFYHTEYGYAFAVMAKKACYSCRFRGNNRTGDLMLGDFWGVDPQAECWKKEGVSAILVHNQKGLDFLQSTPGVKLYETTFQEIVKGNKNIVYPREQRAEREKFERLLASHDLFYAAKHSKNFLARAKAFLKGKR